MKIAVIGGGSTYTPELVSGLSRERERIDVTELVLHDVDAERRDVVGGMARRMLERQGFAGTLEVTGDLDRAVEGADFVLLQIRVGGQAARLSDETVPLLCGCVGQETTGAGGLRQGAAHGAGRARDRRARPRAGRARHLDRRLHEPGRDRHAGAARPRAPGDRALQRGDRAAALGGEAARGRARRACSSTRSGSTT